MEKFEGQNYRDNLAHKLKEIRNSDEENPKLGKVKAEGFLDAVKMVDPRYKQSSEEHKVEIAKEVTAVFEAKKQLFEKFLDAKIKQDESELLKKRYYPQDAQKIAERMWYSKYGYGSDSPLPFYVGGDINGRYKPEFLDARNEVEAKNRENYKALQEEIVGKTDRIKAKENFEQDFFEGTEAISTASDKGIVLFNYDGRYRPYNSYDYLQNIDSDIDPDNYNWERYSKFKADLLNKAHKIVGLLEFSEDKDALVKAAGIDKVSFKYDDETIYETTSNASSEERKDRFLKSLDEFKKTPEELAEEQAQSKAKEQAKKEMAEKKKIEREQANFQKFDPSI